MVTDAVNVYHHLTHYMVSACERAAGDYPLRASRSQWKVTRDTTSSHYCNRPLLHTAQLPGMAQVAPDNHPAKGATNDATTHMARVGRGDGMRTLLSIVGIVAGILMAAYGTLYALIDGLSTSRIVMLLMFVTIALLSGILLTLWIVNRVGGRSRKDFTEERAIDGQWHELENYRAPVAALPPARYITVPKYQVNGASQPLGLVQPAAPATVLRTSTDGGEALTVPLSKLVRFLSLPTPARGEWRGDRSAYGAALAFCDAHGLLDRQSNGGATWRAEYPPDRRREWAEQFDQVTHE